MRKRFLRFMLVFGLVYGVLNLYVGVRGWQWLGMVAPGRTGWAYWVPFWILASAFLLARFGAKALPRPVVRGMAVVGAYWLAVFQYVLPLLLVIDLCRLVLGWAGAMPAAAALRLGAWTGGVTLLALTGLIAYGFWRARTPVVVPYEIAIAKSGGKHDALHVVLVSDTHLGQINGVGRLRHMVRMVNALEPDLVLIAGDLIDDDMGPFVAQDMGSELKRLKARLGTYAILGNHDYPDAQSEAYRALLERAGVRLLVDEWELVDESFYLIGRDDLAGRAYRGRPRKPLEELVAGVDGSLPLILMDHQPYRLEEAEWARIDLQVSGHTHRGQMFPYHLITRRTFELDWGYLRKGALHVIVSLGFGTWGPPLRIGNRPEVVSIRIRFGE